MHEMSLAENLLALIEEESRKQGFRCVHTVTVAIGVLGPVEPMALQFCFAAVARGTIAHKARLQIETVPANGFCPDCGYTGSVTEWHQDCPRCALANLVVTGGDDFFLTGLEVI